MDHDKSLFSLSRTNITSLYHQGKIANSQTQPPRFWKRLGSTSQPTQWRYINPNASVLRKVTLVYFPPRLFQEGWLINLELAHPFWAIYGCRKGRWLEGTPNVFSLGEKSECAWEILLSNIGDKHHIASSYNQGKTAIPQKSPISDWKRLGRNMYSTLWKDKPKCLYAQ